MSVICWNVEREIHKPTGRDCTSWTRVIQSWRDQRHPVQPPLWRGKTDAERGMPRFDWSHRANPRQSVVNRKRDIQTRRQEERLAGVGTQKEQVRNESKRLNPLTEWNLFMYIMKHIHIYPNIYFDTIKLWLYMYFLCQLNLSKSPFLSDCHLESFNKSL